MNAATTIEVTVMASDSTDATARVLKHLAKVSGFALTGRTEIRSERHNLWTVEVADLGGDKDDLWIVLTSYGISPAKGVSAFGDRLDRIAVKVSAA